MHSCVLLGKNYREAKSSLICLIQLYCKEYAKCMCFVGERKNYGGSESRPNCFLVQAGGVYQSWVRPLVAHSEEQQAVIQPCLWSWSIVPEQLSHQSLWAWGGDSQNVCVPKYHLNRTTWNNCLVLDGGSVAAQRRGSELPKSLSYLLLFSASPRLAFVAVVSTSGFLCASCPGGRRQLQRAAGGTRR